MGNGQSVKQEPPSQHFEPMFASQKQIRASIRSKTPMPADPNELERRFTKVLTSMDLPPDKAKLLKQYDDEKKWDIICDQERVHAKDPPTYYLNKLRTYLDPKASRSSKKRRLLGDSTSTQVLKDLEISLRTNHIDDWLLKFLYRTFSMASGVAGLQAITCPDRRVVNIDLTDIVSGHSDYSEKIGLILKLIKIRTLDDVPLEFESVLKKSASDLPHVTEPKVSMTSLRPSRSVESLVMK